MKRFKRIDENLEAELTEKFVQVYALYLQDKDMTLTDVAKKVGMNSRQLVHYHAKRLKKEIQECRRNLKEKSSLKS